MREIVYLGNKSANITICPQSTLWLKQTQTKTQKVLDVFLKKKGTSKESDYLISKGSMQSVCSRQRKGTWAQGHSERFGAPVRVVLGAQAQRELICHRCPISLESNKSGTTQWNHWGPSFINNELKTKATISLLSFVTSNKISSWTVSPTLVAMLAVGGLKCTAKIKTKVPLYRQFCLFY